MKKEEFKQVSKNIKKQLKLFRKVLKDKRTPLVAKILLGAAVGYLLLPFDLIPDFIPGIGQLDDLIIVPALVYTAIKLIPKEIITEYKIETGLQFRSSPPHQPLCQKGENNVNSRKTCSPSPP